MSEDGKRIFVISYRGKVLCLSNSGNLIWEYDTESHFVAAPAFGENKLFFGLDNGLFCCIDTKKGELLWKKEVKPLVCPPVYADGKIVMGIEDTLYVLYANSGNVFETYEIGSKIYSIALFEEKLILGTYKGEIFCLKSAEKNFFSLMRSN